MAEGSVLTELIRLAIDRAVAANGTEGLVAIRLAPVYDQHRRPPETLAPSSVDIKPDSDARAIAAGLRDAIDANGAAGLRAVKFLPAYAPRPGRRLEPGVSEVDVFIACEYTIGHFPLWMPAGYMGGGLSQWLGDTVNEGGFAEWEWKHRADIHDTASFGTAFNHPPLPPASP